MVPWVGGAILAAVIGVVAAFETPLLLVDIRPLNFTSAPDGPRLMARRLAKVHGDWDQWQRLPCVRLELRGHVPFLPARLKFDLEHVDVELDLEFVPARHGHYRVMLRQGRDISRGHWDTRAQRDGTGLLLDSVRHLFELPLSGQVIPLQQELAPALHQGQTHARTLVSWSTFAPQSEVDQLIIWTRDGRLTRFDTTARDISPFTRARVEYEGRVDIDGFSLPRVATIVGVPNGRLIHRWELMGANIVP